MPGLIDLASFDDAALAAINAGAGLTRTAVKTSAYTAAAGDLIPVDTTAGNVTVTLPAAPADKAKVTVKHIIQGGTNTVTVACGGGDVLNKAGGNTTATLTLVNQGATYEYQASTHIWTVTAGDLPLTGLNGTYAGINRTVFQVPTFADAWRASGQPYLVGDGVTDDAPAINYVIRQASVAGGGIILLPVGAWYCFSTVYLGFGPGSAPSAWSTATTPTPWVDGDTVGSSFFNLNVTLQGGGMYATKLIRGASFDGILVDMSGSGPGGVSSMARRNNLERLNLDGGMGLGNTSLKPVLRNYYATTITLKDVDILNACGEGWRLVQTWDSMFYHVRVDNCGGYSTAAGGTTTTPNATPTYPAVHVMSAAVAADGTTRPTVGQFGYTTDSCNNLKWRDLTIETYRDGALWIDGSSPGYPNGCNNLTFGDLKCDTTSRNGTDIVITAGVGGNLNQQRANTNIMIDGLNLVSGATISGGGTGPWPAMKVQDTTALNIKDAVVSPTANVTALSYGIQFNGNNTGVTLDNLGFFRFSGSGVLGLVNFNTGQNDVTITSWGMQNQGGGIPLVVGTPTLGEIARPYINSFGGSGSNESTNGAVLGGRALWLPSGNAGTSILQAGDSQPRLQFKPDGSVWFGPGSSTAADTSLTRSAAGVVQSNGAFKVSGLTGATAATRWVGGTASGAPTSGTFLVGDYSIDQAGGVWVCTVAGTPGTWTKGGGSIAAASDATITSPVSGQVLQWNGSKWVNANVTGTGNVSSDANGHIADALLGPSAQGLSVVRRTGALSETFSRSGAAMGTNSITSGRLYLFAIPLLKGMTVSNVTFMSGTTALAGGNNYWFGLWSSALAQLGLTADQTSTAWAASSEKTLALASPYSVTADGLFYVSLMVNATTPPNIIGLTSGNTANALLAPTVAGFDGNHTGLTTPASAPATAAITTGAIPFWAWAS